ncbi:MAG: hypothetical protein ABIV04_22360 [Massilia sp.]
MRHPLLKRARRRQRGVALPVMLIILMVMVMGSVYLFKASNSSTLTSANMAYDAALAKDAELGLLSGYQWLFNTAKTSKGSLVADDANNGYRATLDSTITSASGAFWSGSKTIDGSAGNRIEYVVHRMCSSAGGTDAVGNYCVLTSPNTSILGTSAGTGTSLASDAPAFNGSVLVHYVVTARIAGPRGGNVVTQLVVLIGA